MKPNGMRAWRRKQNRHWRETGAPCVADGTGRWYRRQQAFFKQRPAVPHRPFTPRSLVGMTMGARKRMAWAEYLSACKESDPGLLVAASLQTWNEHELEAGFQRWRERQNQIRARYCIGERLRPCEGCCACKSKRLTPRLAKREGHGSFAGSLNVARTYWICGVLIMREGVDYGPFHRTEKHCDGSGVLPARGMG